MEEEVGWACMNNKLHFCSADSFIDVYMLTIKYPV